MFLGYFFILFLFFVFMKAYIYDHYGGPEVLEVKDVSRPVPTEDEVLVRIIATPVNTGDVRIRKADPPVIKLFNGFTPKRKILGIHFSGVVESVGKNVKKFKKGDKVFGSKGMDFGTYAEYVCVNEKGPIALKPKNLTFEESSAILFGGITALFFLKKGEIKKDEEVLINAATGAVGTAAVQIAKYYGAKVTAVCSKKNFSLVKSLGADKIIDYKNEDFTKGDKKYDIIYETIGVLNFGKVKNSLKKGGRFITNNASLSDYVATLYANLFFGKKVVLGVSKDFDLKEIVSLVNKEKLKPVIDTIYPFEKMVEAHKKVDTGRKVGNIVVRVSKLKK